MSQYYMLLKNGMVDFDKLLIEKYSFIGLDEVEQGVFKLKNTVLKTEEMKNIEELNEIFNIEGEKYAYKK